MTIHQNNKSKKIFRKTRSNKQKGGLGNPGWNLCEASRKGNIDEAKKLIDEAKKHGETPLYQIVNFTSQDGETPLTISSRTNQLEIIQHLLDAGADVHKPNGDGRTPILSASASGHWRIVIQLLAKGGMTDVNIPDNNSETPLIAASINGQIETVKILLAAGADMNAKLQNGDTALKLATDNNYNQIAELLKKHAAAQTIQPHLDNQADRLNMGMVWDQVHVARDIGRQRMPQDILYKIFIDNYLSAPGSASRSGHRGGKRKTKRNKTKNYKQKGAGG